MQTFITKPTRKNDKKDPRSIMEIFQEKKKIKKKNYTIIINKNMSHGDRVRRKEYVEIN